MLFELGTAYQNYGIYDEALKHLTEALVVLEPTASEWDKAQVQNQLGVLAFRQHHWDQAEIAFQRTNALPYVHQSGNIDLQAKLANNLGNVYLQKGRLAEAESFLRQAWDCGRIFQADVQLANTIGSLAEVLVKQGRDSEAVPLYQQAITLLIQYPDDIRAQKRLLPEFREQLQRLEKDNDPFAC